METIRIAATALAANKLRSFLTLLGVIIGVMTVVSVVSIISGLNNYIAEKVFTLNPDVILRPLAGSTVPPARRVLARRCPVQRRRKLQYEP